MRKTIFQMIFMVFAFLSLLTGKRYFLSTFFSCNFNDKTRGISILEADSFVMSMRNLPTSDDYQMPLSYNGIFKRTFQDYFDGMSTYEMK